MRACLYARVSTEDQAEHGTSLSDQQERTRLYCEALGWQVVEAISDDFTGRMMTRPGIARINALAEARSIDVLVCMKLDRLARMNHLRRGYEEWLGARGVSVVFVEQTFEDSSSGRLQRGVMGEFAEFESEQIRERTTAGRLRKAESGRPPVLMRTYGYHQISVAESKVIPEYMGRSGELIVLPEQAAVVQRVFALYAAGSTPQAIAAMLESEGVPSRLGAPWHANSVANLIRNETYSGVAYYNRQESRRTGALTRSGNIEKRRKTRLQSDWISLSAPAIISPDLWEECQRRRRERTTAGRPTQAWPLHGVVHCSECRTKWGTPRLCGGVTGWNNAKYGGKRYRYYRCRSRNNSSGSPYCPACLPADKLEAMALSALTRAARPGQLLALARRELAQRLRTTDPAGDVRRVEAALRELDEEEHRIADLILAGITRRIVDGKLASLRERGARLASELARARLAARADSPAVVEAHAERSADALRLLLPELKSDPAEFNRLARLYLRILLTPAGDASITVILPPVSV